MTAIPPDTNVGLEFTWLLNRAIALGTRMDQVLEFFNPAGGLPVLPALNDRYIASSTANGWIMNNIQYWNGKIWVSITPTTGELLYVVGGGTFAGNVILWNGSGWQPFSGSGTGNVSGPGASTVGAVALWNNNSGTLLQNSVVLIDGTGNINTPGCLFIKALETACRDVNGNLILGNGNLTSITTGSGNAVVGDGVGITLTTGTNNFLAGIGANVLAGATSNAVGIGNGVTVSTSSVVVGSGSSSGAGNTGAVVIGIGLTAFEPDLLYISSSNTSGAGGGNVQLQAKDGVAGFGAGTVSILSGQFGASGTGIGGSIVLQAQPTSGSGTAGNVSIIAGSASGTGNGGNITLTTGTTVTGTAGIISVVNGALVMPSGQNPATVSAVLTMTTVTGTPTSPNVFAGAVVLDTANLFPYYYDGTNWRTFAISNVLNSESFSVAGGANHNPNNAFAISYITTTGAGVATGTLANGTYVGQIKYIVISATPVVVVNYQMTITSGIDGNGAVMTTITYTSAGGGSTLTWDGTHWLILNSGGVVA
jgi:hypothetical protein